MTEVVISVDGRFELSHPPERATVDVEVSATAPSRDGAYASAVQSARVIAERTEPLYDREAGPVTTWVSDDVRTWTQQQWGPDQRPMAPQHWARVGFRVRFADFEVMSGWITDVAAVPHVSISGVTWALTEQRLTRLTEQVRTAAVHDARNKAQTYASSLALGPVRVVAIADVGLLDGPSNHSGAHPMAARFAAAEVGGGLRLVPEDVRVSAAVQARFVTG